MKLSFVISAVMSAGLMYAQSTEAMCIIDQYESLCLYDDEQYLDIWWDVNAWGNTGVGGVCPDGSPVQYEIDENGNLIPIPC